MMANCIFIELDYQVVKGKVDQADSSASSTINQLVPRALGKCMDNRSRDIHIVATAHARFCLQIDGFITPIKFDQSFLFILRKIRQRKEKKTVIVWKAVGCFFNFFFFVIFQCSLPPLLNEGFSRMCLER